MINEDDRLMQLFAACSNAGRWGDDDELGTLNFITPAVRRAALDEVRLGESVSIGLDLDVHASSKNTDPLVHVVDPYERDPLAARDRIEIAAHGFTVTHLDAVAHVFWEGAAYNGRSAREILGERGLRYGSVHAARDGIVTRGVLLDVAAARGVPWLQPGDWVSVADLEAAESLAGARVTSGDAVFAHVGLGRREREQGPEDPSLRAGLDADCLAWLHEREVAVWSGDCVERLPYPSTVMPLPLHQIGLAAMGLCLLDCPDMDALVAACEAHRRATFALVIAPLRIPGGTGSPVNPLALF
ncbi:cyclase family protein [Jiangella muralis]|uniref:cyclase family protein n=1 Tax=Jiangella muralis TaxID=702383 RepID=UPI00069E568C|nr:cyclase family protein [Jiangella muralis]